MNSYPLISLIIPCYNAKDTLEQCLNSVIHQTYHQLQIIIVDDGSNDGSRTIYEEFQKKDQRIEIHRQANAGVSRARNEGVKAARGEYICFVDSDDWVEPNYCSELYGLLISENADISIVEASYEDENRKVVFNKPVSDEKIFDGTRALNLLLEDQVIQSHPWGKLYKSTFVKSVKFPENLKCFEDYSTLFKVFDKAVKVVRSNAKLYHYIQRETSLSHNLSPQTAYLFYLAITEVYNFWKSTANSNSYAKISKNFIRKLLMVLKRILRNTTIEEMRSEKENIRQSFKQFLSYSVNEIGIEYYFYIRLYYYYPEIYSKLISKR